MFLIYTLKYICIEVSYVMSMPNDIRFGMCTKSGILFIHSAFNFQSPTFFSPKNWVSIMQCYKCATLCRLSVTLTSEQILNNTHMIFPNILEYFFKYI